MNKVKIVSFEGNIGAGKTTLLNKLEKENTDPYIVFLREPVDEWEKISIDGVSMISKFYADPEKYSFAFQIMAFTTRLKLLKEIIKNKPNVKLIICERSLEADNEIFARMLYHDGLMDQHMYLIYKNHFNNSIEKEYKLSGMIYIKTLPVECFNRIVKRARKGEDKITLTYLEKCDKYHLDWIGRFKEPVLHKSSNDTLHFDIYSFLQRLLLRNDCICAESK